MYILPSTFNTLAQNTFLSDNGLLYIAMGFCEGGDLYTKLKEQKGKALEERQIVEWYVQISMALQVCSYEFLLILTKTMTSGQIKRLYGIMYVSVHA